MFRNWKLTTIWMLMLLTLNEANLATLRKRLEGSLQNIRNETKFGRKITSTVISTTPTTISTMETLTDRSQKISENLDKLDNTTVEELTKGNLTDDGLLWRSMTDGKTWKGYHAPETNVNISSPNSPSYNSETSKYSYNQPGTSTYIYIPASPTSNPHNSPVYVPGSGDAMMPNIKYSPDAKNDGLSRSPRYGTPHSGMMGNKNQYQEQSPPSQYGGMTPSYDTPSYGMQTPAPAPAPSYNSYNSPMTGGNMYGSHMPSGQMPGGHTYNSPMPGGNTYSNPMSGGNTYSNPMAGGNMYSSPMPGGQMYPMYGGTMMAAPKEDSGMKGLLNKLLAFLPIGLLLAVALPSLIVLPTRRSLDEDFNQSNITKWVHSYPILDMISYYGVQAFQNETCFRHIVCETVKMGSRDGANVFQKQLWSMANKIDEKMANNAGLKDLWEGITRHGCQQFQCKWMGDTGKKT
ncbi:hypothetical protein CHUAL_009904 [Chamberlinius hualienensis]